jgi:quinol monooxygenase YgiN
MPRERVQTIAHLRARPHTTEELKSLLTSSLEPTRQELGCIRFELLWNRDAPAEVGVVSEWQGEEAVQHPTLPLVFLPQRRAGTSALR